MKTQIKALTAVFLVSLLLIGSSILLFPELPVAKAEPTFLSVNILPNISEVYPFKPQTFIASCNSSSAVYEWFAFCSGSCLVEINGVTITLHNEFKFVAVGESLVFKFVELTECLVRLRVEASSSDGYGVADIGFHDPYSSSGVYLDALPSMASFVDEADGSGWFHAISSIGQQSTSGTNSTDVIQYSMNETESSGGMVFVKAGVYSATVIVQDNVTFVLDYGVSGVAYSVEAGADCTIIDYPNGNRTYYKLGSVAIKLDIATGNILGGSGNFTTGYFTNIDAIGTGTGVHVLKLIVENGTTMPSSPIERQVFFETDTGLLWIRNNSAWVQIGATAYSNISGTPDLTVYLTHDGTTALSGNWNVGGVYGIYGAVQMNATTMYVSTLDELTSGSGVKILKLIVENGTTLPASPIERQMFFETDTGILWVRNNSAWQQIGTTDYDNLTNTPDLTVYLNKDGTTALTGNWNVGGSYGIYGCVWINSTNANFGTYYLGNETLGFVQLSTFLIDKSGSTFRVWHGANQTLLDSGTNSSALIETVLGYCSVGNYIVAKENVVYGALTFLTAVHLEVCTANETLAAGDIVFFNGTTQKYGLADADANTTIGYGYVGMAVTNATADGLFLLLKQGRVHSVGWTFTAGYPQYISTVAGDLTETQPVGSGDQVMWMGWAWNSTVVDLDVSKIYTSLS